MIVVTSLIRNKEMKSKG